MLRSFDQLRWDNTFARLPPGFYHAVRPTPLAHPRMAAFNPAAAALLDLDPAQACDPGFLAAINGTRDIPGTTPLAAVYAGHQFGVWVPQLGDGRAILLGEVTNTRHQRWDIQVKGAGMTRFSRMGDGRAVLRSTVREYLGAEAMHGLGIATTRSLAIVASEEAVYRERQETGALLVRLAPSHVRFGSFEYFASRGDVTSVQQLANWVIELHYPHLLALPLPARHAVWYREVVEHTARLVAQWTAVGFAHGVLNTDNMSILGITLDYGPYAWMDRYDRGLVCNHSDTGGRYAFDQQPRVGLWNCARLGEALHSLVAESDAVEALHAYRAAFESEMDALMRAKLGLTTSEPDDVTLVGELFAVLHDHHADYTRFFRALSRVATNDNGDALRIETGPSPALDAWLIRYRERLARDDADDDARRDRMLRINPKYVLRNWMAQEVIEAAEAGNFGAIDAMRELLETPYDEHEEQEQYARPPAPGSEEISVSCSS